MRPELLANLNKLVAMCHQRVPTSVMSRWVHSEAATMWTGARELPDGVEAGGVGGGTTPAQRLVWGTARLAGQQMWDLAVGWIRCHAPGTVEEMAARCDEIRWAIERSTNCYSQAHAGETDWHRHVTRDRREVGAAQWQDERLNKLRFAEYENEMECGLMYGITLDEVRRYQAGTRKPLVLRWRDIVSKGVRLSGSPSSEGHGTRGGEKGEEDEEGEKDDHDRATCAGLCFNQDEVTLWHSEPWRDVAGYGPRSHGSSSNSTRTTSARMTSTSSRSSSSTPSGYALPTITSTSKCADASCLRRWSVEWIRILEQRCAALISELPCARCRRAVMRLGESNARHASAADGAMRAIASFPTSAIEVQPIVAAVELHAIALLRGTPVRHIPEMPLAMHLLIYRAMQTEWRTRRSGMAGAGAGASAESSSPVDLYNPHGVPDIGTGGVGQAGWRPVWQTSPVEGQLVGRDESVGRLLEVLEDVRMTRRREQLLRLREAAVRTRLHDHDRP